MISRLASGAALCALGGAALLAAGTATAADHRDSPSQLDNPQADINDIYAFMNENPGREGELVLVMTVVQDAQPSDRFATDIAYDFLIESATEAAPTVPVGSYRLRCTFETPESVTCTLGERSVSGQFGQTGEAEGFRVYTGLHEDPFYFNGPGLNMLLPEGDEFADMPGGVPMEVFAAAAATNESGSADSFAGENTLALVIGVDSDFLTDNQTAPILKIWAATSPSPL